jgi:hypothetical protein
MENVSTSRATFSSLTLNQSPSWSIDDKNPQQQSNYSYFITLCTLHGSQAGHEALVLHRCQERQQFQEGSQGTKGYKKNKQTDPNKPCMALNAYIIFFAIQRQKLLILQQQQQTANSRLKHVKGGFGSLAWTVSETWRKLDDAYKTKLENLASMDKDRHAREMEAWKATKNLTSQELNSMKKLKGMRIKRGMADELTARIKEIAQQEAAEFD